MNEPETIAIDKELQLDWDLYRDVPEAIVQEEGLLLDYFRTLQFLYLERRPNYAFSQTC